jgi:hypothetical protein
MFWDQLELGLAPLLIGIYFFGAVQLFFIGMLGEYIGAIHTQIHKRPLVVERERINFDEDRISNDSDIPPGTKLKPVSTSEAAMPGREERPVAR